MSKNYHFFAMSLVAFVAVSGLAQAELFPAETPSKQYVEFKAEGFNKPVSGVIFNLDNPATNGVPLGGVDTGCIDLETSGMWGYSTIFNSHVPRRGPMNRPFLGLHIEDTTWVLCDPKQEKSYERHDGIHPVPPANPPLEKFSAEGVKLPSQISYWGHYPVADLEYKIDAPVSVGLRAWSSFLPGDVVDSMIPGAVFEVNLRNMTNSSQEGTLVFSFPGPSNEEAGSDTFERRNIRCDFTGVEVKSPKSSYILGVIGSETIRIGGQLGSAAEAWAQVATSLPELTSEQPGTAVALDFDLKSKEEKTVRFLLAWSSPQWQAGGHQPAPGNTFTHMYAKYYPTAADAAHKMTKDHESLLKRILAWQEVIYAEKTYPAWLKDALVNYLYLITEDGLWAQAKVPLPDWIKPEDGLFGLSESPRACPQIECIPCSFYGNMPVVYFFPELALSTLRGYKGYQFDDGAAPWVFGGCTKGTGPTEFAMPGRSYQMTTDGICYASMVDRYRMCWGDEKFVQEFHESVKQNLLYTINLCREGEIGDRVISMPTGEPGMGGEAGTTWFEHPSDPWVGMVTHVGGLHLAQVKIAGRIAELAGDTQFARQCQDWFDAGSRSMENKMWNKTNYLSFWEPATSKKNDTIFAFQLDGQWISEIHGLGDIFRPDRIETTLNTVKEYNLPLTPYGAVAWANPDKTAPTGGGYTLYGLYASELYMLAMNYMYEGQTDVGLDLAHRITEHMVLRLARGWNLPIHMRADTGDVTLGYDYYQNMMLWTIPAALEGKPFNAPCKPGGLVDRITKAAGKD